MTQSPTIGRRLHFWPNLAHAALLGVFDHSQPCDAGVIYVHNDGCVNLDVTGPSGAKLAVQKVPLVIPGGDSAGEGESYATWMPYQLAKAAAESQPLAMLAPVVAEPEPAAG